MIRLVAGAGCGLQCCVMSRSFPEMLNQAVIFFRKAVSTSLMMAAEEATCMQGQMVAAPLAVSVACSGTGFGHGDIWVGTEVVFAGLLLPALT